MFIKHSNGKIATVLEQEELTETQKKTVKDLTETTVKISETETDASNMKKSGR